MTASHLRRDAALNRQRILLAAREVFATRGLDATLDQVAHHAGLGVGTVYRRFPGKRELIDALFEEEMNEIQTMAERALAEEDPWQGLIRFMEEAQGKQARDRGLREALLGSGHGSERLAEARGRVLPVVGALVERAQATGRLRADFSYTDLVMLGLMVGAVADYTRDVHPEVWRRYFTIMLDGLRADPGTPSALHPKPLTEGQLEHAMTTWGGKR
jgi:AcrR family transcriptional regulator